MQGSPYALTRLRPMTAGDIIDEAIGLYRRNLRTFIIIGAVALVPLGLVQIVLTLIAGTTDLIMVGIFSIVSSVLSFFAYILVWSASISAAASALLGEPTDARRAYDHALGHLGPVIGLALLYGIAVFLLMFTIVGGIYFAIAWVFAYHALIVEGRGIRESLSRSRRLVSGHWWRVVGIGLIVYIIWIVIVLAFSLPAMLFGADAFINPTADASPVASVLSTIGNTAGTIVAGPILYCTITMLYYDLRVCKEGYDIELAVGEMEAALNAAQPGLTR